ncbi:hypothetical protein BGW38_005297 [Lunasporangiospora selenospora]|uniref:Uncharacterized protein n=1 Tax=Lunasporangiospora selenospora TaxID=979761 RepID=A0A9P6KGJ2_9FUNG|nr:hypothetical protein BGW38_005297 [Lunasporangiospora selenospora]
MGTTIAPLSSGQPLWYYTAAVSVLAAAVGVFGMLSALLANRLAVKAFEAFYVLSLLTQLALIIWALIWFKQNQTQWDTGCSAAKTYNVNLSFIPSFASDWSCQKLFMAIVLTVAIGGVIWVGFNFYMTNRVIHYARELFAMRSDRYKVLSEAATKELDREQQIPLTDTSTATERDGYHNSRVPPTSYRDEIEYKDNHSSDPYSRAAAAGFGSYPQAQIHFQPQNVPGRPPAPGFSHRDSTQGMDLMSPYHDPSMVNDPMSPYSSQPPSNAFAAAEPSNAYAPPEPRNMSGLGLGMGMDMGAGTGASSSTGPGLGMEPVPATGQSFTHTTKTTIQSPFDDEDDNPVPVVSTTGLPSSSSYSPDPNPRSPVNPTSPTAAFSPKQPKQ